MRTKDSSVLGDIVRETYKFMHEGKYDSNHKIASPTDGYESMSAGKFFNQYKEFQGSFIVKQDRLPVDPNINAIVLRKGRVMIETSRVDLDKLAQGFADFKIPVQVRGKSIFDQDSEIIKTRTQNIARNSVNRRTVIYVLPEYQTPEWENSMSALDILDHQNCFKPDFLPSAYQEARTQNLELLQNLELRQEIRQLQTPKLIQTLSLNFYMTNSLRVLKMNQQELIAHARNELDNNSFLEVKK